MGQNFNATNSGGANTVMDNLLENTNTLRSGFSGTSHPGTPVAGQVSHRTDEGKRYVYGDIDGGGADWFEVVLAHNLCDVDWNDYEMVDMRVDNRSSDRTPGAGNVGAVYLETTGGRMKIVKDSSTLDAVMHGSNAEFIRERHLAGSLDLDATNPPTAVTVGTTPTIRGLLFDATNEKVGMSFQVPDGYSADTDLFVEVACYLNAAETANDTIDATLDLVSLTPNNNELANKTSTQATISHDIGANTAQYSLHTFRFTIDYDDATNPVAAGDMLECEFALSSVASVAGIIVRSFALLSPFGGTTLES